MERNHYKKNLCPNELKDIEELLDFCESYNLEVPCFLGQIPLDGGSCCPIPKNGSEIFAIEVQYNVGMSTL